MDGAQQVTISLQQALSELRSRILRYRDSRINEEATKPALIQPVLRALGWNVEEIDEVHPEYRRKSTDNPVDYALMVLREPKLFVEAKALGEDLGDPRWANQFISYATAAGVKWILLTNGDEYRVYNAFAEAPVEQKIFRKVRISDDDSRAIETLELLAKECLERNELERLWQAESVDQKVHRAIQKLFTPEGDRWLVNAIRKQTADLTPSDIRSSLRRMRLRLDFPDEPALPPREPRPSPVAEPRQTDGITVRDLIQAGCIHPPLTLEKMYKGRRFTAVVQDDGRIMFDGGTYNSLSLSAAAARAQVIGTPPSRSYPQTNGWTFWHFRGDNGKLTPVSALREQYAKAHSHRQ